MSHNKSLKQAWVISVERSNDAMPLLILHHSPNLLKYLTNIANDKIIVEQYLFGSQVKSQAELDMALMLDESVKNDPKLKDLPVDKFTYPIMFDTEAEAKESLKSLLELQDMYYNGLLVESLDNIKQTNLITINLYDLYDKFPKAATPTEPKNDNKPNLKVVD